MKMNQPFISIIIPLFNEEKYITKCLESLLTLDYPKAKYEIIVVDNGSSDNSRELVNQYNVKIFSRPCVKVGEVRNYGVFQSRGEILVFIDSDCTVESDWLKQGIKEIEHLDAVGGLAMLRKNPSWIEKNWVLNSSKYFKYQNTFSGACIFIKRKVFEYVGGFDTSLNAGEDSALTNTLRNHGFSISINPILNVTHLGYPTTILEFILRQKWHSSDYIFRLNKVFTDKILFLVVLYFISLLVLISTFFLYSSSMFFFLSLLLTIFIPAILSVKRILRFGGLKKEHSILSIYIVDVFYLVGRVYGLFSGFLSLASPNKVTNFKK